MVRTKWPLSPVFGPHLKVWQVIVLLWNQLFEKMLYTCTSTINVPISCYGFFLSTWSKSCAQIMPFEFSEKIKFWPNSETNVALSCNIVQMSFHTFERAFLPVKNAEICIKIDVQMATISLFEWLNLWYANRFPSVTNKKNRKTPNFSFSRRRVATDLHQTLREDWGCPYHFCARLIFQSDQ